jgi:monoamine oxidase
MPHDSDIIILGAGAAGLAAATELSRAGLKVLILEARDRIGGRMFTKQDPRCHAPVELGAEFIHGRPPEIWDLLRQHHAVVKEVEGDYWCYQERKLRPCHFFSQVEAILEKMNDQGPDLSFAEFLARCCPERKSNPKQQEAIRWALGYVKGFHAADPKLISVHSLVKGQRAEQQIDGDRAFRIANGYAWLVEIFRQDAERAGVAIELRNVAQSIHWGKGQAEVVTRTSSGTARFTAPRLLVTLPLGVLQAAPGEGGAVRFNPELPRSKQAAIGKLVMGKVNRVVLRFRERLWDGMRPVDGSHAKTLSDLSFLFSQEHCFPTWWTTMPDKLPIITGWAPSDCADELSGQGQAEVVDKALSVLAQILGERQASLKQLLEAAYWHDWQKDPFARGAYSYVKVGGEGAQREFAAPVEETLFFAGEASDFTGHHGTVHGAMASGYRAAENIRRAQK